MQQDGEHCAHGKEGHKRKGRASGGSLADHEDDGIDQGRQDADAECVGDSRNAQIETDDGHEDGVAAAEGVGPKVADDEEWCSDNDSANDVGKPQLLSEQQRIQRQYDEKQQQVAVVDGFAVPIVEAEQEQDAVACQKKQGVDGGRREQAEQGGNRAAQCFQNGQHFGNGCAAMAAAAAA